MRIPSLVPAIVRGDVHSSSADARDETLASASEATRLLRDLVPCSAYALCGWNPLWGHRHKTLASEGYSERLLDHVNDEFVRDSPLFPLLRSREPRALRWCDLQRECHLTFARTFTAEHYVLPEGFREGTTVCLRLPDGRYTGALHVSWSSPRDATEKRRDRIDQFSPLLARVCDLLQAPKLLADELLPDSFALLVSADGGATELPDRPVGTHLAAGGALRELLLRRWPREARRRFLWIDEGGGCHRVQLVPCRGGVALVSEQPVASPRGLTSRELEVLHLVAAGHSNPEIARRLFVSTRTVSTHVEHILAKLACTSRSQLAARAVDEGLLLAEDPGRAGVAEDSFVRRRV